MNDRQRVVRPVDPAVRAGRLSRAVLRMPVRPSTRFPRHPQETAVGRTVTCEFISMGWRIAAESGAADIQSLPLVAALLDPARGTSAEMRKRCRTLTSDGRWMYNIRPPAVNASDLENLRANVVTLRDDPDPGVQRRASRLVVTDGDT